MVQGDAPVRSSDIKTSVTWLNDKVMGIRKLRLNHDELTGADRLAHSAGNSWWLAQLSSMECYGPGRCGRVMCGYGLVGSWHEPPRVSGSWLLEKGLRMMYWAGFFGQPKREEEQLGPVTPKRSIHESSEWTNQARSLRNYHTCTLSGRYVATKSEPKLGRYVATELGRYVATELEPKLGRYVATERPSCSVAM
ncbi:hypothetical protein F2Q70_00021663 [Brassica cretica]|uniref:Uncharacterized protein n=1 Tax=Brassica cretica TaxID=69181 RepID=A0A8S9GZY8_BRACR|nr:hypothetical protein F2Q70_00021663 [Brassica cretica]